ncbi:MAG: conjugal transfer protein [Lachnospiraceae bacterium]|nr:conjugal transfer protein [Lachnospiraceae bacterium]
MFKTKKNDIDNFDNKAKKIKIKRAGTHRVSSMLLWVLLLGSIGFGIYNNINSTTTVIDRTNYTTVEKLHDVNGVQVFVRNFIWDYYSWENTQTGIRKREEKFGRYLTDELCRINKGTVREDVPCSSSVNDIAIWSVEDITDYESGTVIGTDYDVVYTISQRIKEGENALAYPASYRVSVHADEDGNMVITRNPTLCSTPGKSSYVPPVKSADGSVNASDREEIISFLESFFKLYPKASASELAYYVRDNCLEPVDSTLIFSQLLSPAVSRKEGDAVNAAFYVEYIDQYTKMTQISQFDIDLIKDNGNWIIVSSS